MIHLVFFSKSSVTESQGHNRLSKLPDHLLLLVLERLRGDARSLARTCVLSRHWRTLPLMVSELTISVETFLAPAHRDRRRVTASFTGVLHPRRAHRRRQRRPAVDDQDPGAHVVPDQTRLPSRRVQPSRRRDHPR